MNNVNMVSHSVWAKGSTPSYALQRSIEVGSASALVRSEDDNLDGMSVVPSDPLCTPRWPQGAASRRFSDGRIAGSMQTAWVYVGAGLGREYIFQRRRRALRVDGIYNDDSNIPRHCIRSQRGSRRSCRRRALLNKAADCC